MATTWSFKLLAFTWILRRTARVSLRMCLDIGLKFQPRFPGRCGQGFHSSVVHITAAIEHHLFDSGSAGAFSDFFSDHFGGRHIAAALEIGKKIAERTRAAGIEQVVFDRGGYMYHGRVEALAAAAREAGLKF